MAGCSGCRRATTGKLLLGWCLALKAIGTGQTSTGPRPAISPRVGWEPDQIGTVIAKLSGRPMSEPASDLSWTERSSMRRVAWPGQIRTAALPAPLVSRSALANLDL